MGSTASSPASRSPVARCTTSGSECATSSTGSLLLELLLDEVAQRQFLGAGVAHGASADAGGRLGLLLELDVQRLLQLRHERVGRVVGALLDVRQVAHALVDGLAQVLDGEAGALAGLLHALAVVLDELLLHLVVDVAGLAADGAPLQRLRRLAAAGDLDLGARLLDAELHAVAAHAHGRAFDHGAPQRRELLAAHLAGGHRRSMGAPWIKPSPDARGGGSRSGDRTISRPPQAFPQTLNMEQPYPATAPPPGKCGFPGVLGARDWSACPRTTSSRRRPFLSTASSPGRTTSATLSSASSTWRSATPSFATRSAGWRPSTATRRTTASAWRGRSSTSRRRWRS